MNIPNINELKGPQCSEKHFKYHYVEFFNYLNSKYPFLKFQEKLYWYYHNLNEYPVCKICGKKTSFINTKEGYRKYCSRKCLNCDNDKKEKTKQTCIERYGGVAPASSIDVKNKMINTTLKKYGVHNIQQLQEVSQKTKQTCIERYGGVGNASKSIKEKYIKTCIDKYGVENPMQNELIRETIKCSMLEKYGVEHHSQLKRVRLKIQQSRRKIEKIKHPFILDYTQNDDWICKCPHPDCNKCKEKTFIISPLIYEGRIKTKTEICTNLLPVQKYKGEGTTLELFVRNILDEYNIEYETNVKNIIAPKELDIYIPSKNIAIECNGCRYHSTKKILDKKYHIVKTKSCEDKNIELIHLWEDWIKNKKDITKSILLSKLGLISNTIYARKCIIKEIDSKTCNDFLEANHIQGKSASKIKLGLYYNDQLVSVMTFSPPRVNMGSKNHKCQWELVRFVSLCNVRIIGGASKLLKYFIKNYNPKSIVSFSMNDISKGKLYKQLGFVTDNKINQSYWYIEPYTLRRYHRSSFSKHEIVKRGWRDKVDNTWTEREVMEEHGYFCIYDSGQLKWVLNLE